MTYVYFAEAKSGEIKIGCAVDPARRLKQLRYNPGLSQVVTPAEFVKFILVPGSIEIENRLHLRFAHEVIKGAKEWYNPGGEVSDLLNQLTMLEELQRELIVAETIKELASARSMLGKVVLVQIEQIFAACTVKQVKNSYGNWRLLVVPVGGSGSLWVDVARIKQD